MVAPWRITRVPSTVGAFKPDRIAARLQAGRTGTIEIPADACADEPGLARKAGVAQRDVAAHLDTVTVQGDLAGPLDGKTDSVQVRTVP